MLTRDGVIARWLLVFCFYFASGSGLVQGWPATLCGVLGTINLACALLHYSPLKELIDYLQTVHKNKYLRH